MLRPEALGTPSRVGRRLFSRPTGGQFGFNYYTMKESSAVNSSVVTHQILSARMLRFLFLLDVHDKTVHHGHPVSAYRIRSASQEAAARNDRYQVSRVVPHEPVYARLTGNVLRLMF
jgi:hypothetical protein